MAVKFRDITKTPEVSGDEDTVDGRFWNIMESDELKTAVITQILNELEEPVENMSDTTCRTVLARCQGLYWNSIFSKRVTASKRPPESEIPDDYQTQ